MGYSLYTILPKELLPKAQELQKAFRPAGEVFDLEGRCDHTRELLINRELAYSKASHLKKGVLVGIGFTGPATPIREYFYAVVSMIAIEAGIPEGTLGYQRAIYYDGDALIPLFPTYDEIPDKAGEWLACDRDGIANRKGQKQTVMDRMFAIKPRQVAKIRAEMQILRQILKA